MSGVDLIDVAKFEQKVERIPEGGCWVWMGATFGGRYGQVRFGGEPALAHRVAWQLYRGWIPTGMYVFHRCDNGLCVNPDHLFLGSASDNALDRERKGRGANTNGARHVGAKLTPERVAHVRRMVILPKAVALALAAEWGVNEQHLYRVRRERQRWRAA